MSQPIHSVIVRATALLPSYLQNALAREQFPTPPPSEVDVNEIQNCSVSSELTTSTSVFQPREFGRQDSSASFGTTITHFINSQTIVNGANITWDKERLITGKLKRYEQIGGEPLTLITKTGDRISAFHFDVRNFHQELAKMGGNPIFFTIQLNHPFFERAEPIVLKTASSLISVDAVRISYNKELKSEFKNPKEFLVLCQKMSYELFWEEGLKPFEVASWWHFHSMEQNLILIPKAKIHSLRVRADPSNITLRSTGEFGQYFELFRKKYLHSPAIVFDRNIREVEALFNNRELGQRGLKIDRSSWTMIKYEEKIYLMANPAVHSAIALITAKQLTQLKLIQISSKPIFNLNLDVERATIVLTMNQTNSYASYSHEILTFLFAGVNVLAYDNAGKGLSKGRNSQEGMTEAIRMAGTYLIQEKGLRQNQILFKGQCVGGLSSSEAAKLFPVSHVWIDQAPRTFSGTAESLVLKRAEQGVEEESSWRQVLRGAVLFASPLVKGVTSMTLPSYDVVENLKHNHGLQIYTIGVPDERGMGGDEIVPIHERDEIEQALRLNPMGHYLTIKGGLHVTNWWQDPHVAKEIDRLFKQFSLAQAIFPETPKTPEAAVIQAYESFYQKPYDAKALSAEEKSIYKIFEAVKDQEYCTIDHIMNWRDAIAPYNPLVHDD